MEVLALATALLGFTAIALAMDRHYRPLKGASIPAGLQRAARACGALMLGASTAICVALHGWAIGLTWALGLFALAATLVLLALTFWTPQSGEGRGGARSSRKTASTPTSKGEAFPHSSRK